MKALTKNRSIMAAAFLFFLTSHLLFFAQTIPIYKTEENKSKIAAFYDENLRRWPVPHESIFVPTRYGRTHLIACGKVGAPAIVFLHAMGLNATMWLPNVKALSRRHRLYCLDTIGDLGRSELQDPGHFPQNGRDAGLWLRDVFEKLAIGRAAVVGASQGGWFALNLALYAPELVNRVVLLGPMGIPEDALPRVLKQLQALLASPSAAGKEGMIRWTIGDNPRVREAFGRYMNVALDCLARIPLPLPLSDKQLQEIQAPVLLFLGGKDGPIGDPQKVARRAKDFLPHAEVEILPGCGHLINIEEPKRINRRILVFLEAH